MLKHCLDKTDWKQAECYLYNRLYSIFHVCVFFFFLVIVALLTLSNQPKQDLFVSKRLFRDVNITGCDVWVNQDWSDTMKMSGERAREMSAHGLLCRHSRAPVRAAESCSWTPHQPAFSHSAHTHTHTHTHPWASTIKSVFPWELYRLFVTVHVFLYSDVCMYARVYSVYTHSILIVSVYYVSTRWCGVSCLRFCQG